MTTQPHTQAIPRIFPPEVLVEATPAPAFYFGSGAGGEAHIHGPDEFLELHLVGVPAGAHLQEVQVAGRAIVEWDGKSYVVDPSYLVRVGDSALLLRPRAGWQVDAYGVTVLARHNGENLPLGTRRFVVQEVVTAANLNIGRKPSPLAKVVEADQVSTSAGKLCLGFGKGVGGALLVEGLYATLRNYSVGFAVHFDPNRVGSCLRLAAPGGVRLRLSHAGGRWRLSLGIVKKPADWSYNEMVLLERCPGLDRVLSSPIWVSYDGHAVLVSLGMAGQLPLVRASGMPPSSLDDRDLSLGIKVEKAAAEVTSISASTFLDSVQ